MKKDLSKHSTDAELKDCINSAYTDLQILLQGAFGNISKLPNQITICEFITLFENYDWNDIFNGLEELENASDLDHNKSVYSILLESLDSSSKNNPLINPRENTYFKVWAGLMSEQDL